MARAADGGRWLPEDKGITFEYHADDFHEGEAQARLVADTRANQEHIAEWSPARVLREVEAKRQMVEDCNDYIVGDNARTTDGLCVRVLMLLAYPYADRPGYRADEWRYVP